MYKNIFRSILTLLTLLLLISILLLPVTSGLEHRVLAHEASMDLDGGGEIMELTSSTNTDIEGLCGTENLSLSDSSYLLDNQLP